MIIVLVFWQIHDNDEAITSFRKWWSESAAIEDRSGLVGEYLCDAADVHVSFQVADQPPWVTTDAPTRPFVNVAIWKDVDSFYEQVGQYMGQTQPFEVVPRQRVVVNHVASRRGAWGFPGVLNDEVQWT